MNKLNRSNRSWRCNDRHRVRGHGLGAAYNSGQSATPEQRIILLALAEQQVAVREPIGRLDLSLHVLLPLLVQVNATLLYRPARLALGLRELSPHHGVQEREAVATRDPRTRDLLGQRVEHATARVARIEVPEQDL